MAKDAKLAALVAPVEAGLERMRDVLVHALASDVPAVSDMIDHIGRFRGKQLRGALVLLAGRAAGNRDDELPAVASIVELIHLATLVHDDVLDSAEKRRRVASVNRRWDNQVAVLLGDFLYSRAFHLSTTLSSRIASRLLATTTQEICAGEIEQAAGRFDFEMPLERAERIATAKTGALYGAACELGASYPGDRDGYGAALRAFGRELGLAFQLVDDVLDLDGDEDTVGKGVGTDVADGKVTWPVLHVYGAADAATRAAIRDAYTLPGLEDAPGGRLARLRGVCDLAPGLLATRARAESLVASARSRLAGLEAGPARVALEALGDYVLQRNW
ncbi:MAG: polyprenyl synthetase family protein [Planctomycetota bacterium]